MCDYSLEAYKTEEAKQGETYKLDRMPSGSMGLVKTDGLDECVVCMPVGATLRIAGLSDLLQKAYAVSAEEDVEFVKLQSGPHKDAIKFQNGDELSLQRLDRGTMVTMLMPPVAKVEDKDLVSPVEETTVLGGRTRAETDQLEYFV